MSHYDESTYESRFRKFLELTSFKHLLHSRARLENCKYEVETNGSTKKEHLDMYAACIHPNTKEILPVFGRMAFFIPINIPICGGMLIAKPTFINLVFWQWINQTNNAIFNYCNSAKSVALPKKWIDIPFDLRRAYMGSALVSVSLAVGLSSWVKTGRMSPRLKPLLQTMVPFVATATAGMTNVGLMRSKELSTGIPVMNSKGEVLGLSKVAARKALLETMVSRAALPVPMLLFPAPFIAVFSRMSYFKSSFIRKKCMELTFLMVFIALGLPAALALFPQYSKISIDALEESIAILRATSAPDGVVQYNKGI